MTDFDKKLLEEAKSVSQWNYRYIDSLIPQAQTPECRRELSYIRWNLYDLVQASL